MLDPIVQSVDIILVVFMILKSIKMGKKERKGNKNYLKTIYAHIGVGITRNHIYIEDKYADMVNGIK